jgi:hypothetical protein
VFCLSFTVEAEARPYTLEWDANTDNVTTGYRVYYGTAPGTYHPAEGIDVANATEFQLDLLPGITYYFVVRAYNANDELGPPSAELSFFVPDAPPPVTAVAVTPNVASPHFTGEPVTFTANATGTTGNYEYQFILRNPAGVWSIAQPYSSAPDWLLNSETVGVYILQVWARNAGSPEVYEARNFKLFVVLPAPTSPVSAVSVATSLASPQTLGTQVTVTANATGTYGLYQYQFLLRDPAGVWTVVQNYGPASSWTWNTGAGSAGTYIIHVRARNAGSNGAYEASFTVPFEVLPPS